MTTVTTRSRKGDDEMSRYERRMQFERFYAMRQAYRTANPIERRAVISVEAALRLADSLTADVDQDHAGADDDRAKRPSQR